MTGHRQHRHYDGERQRPPEATAEIHQFVILTLVERWHFGLQRHAAFGAVAWCRLTYFWMHGAGIGRAGCRRRNWLDLFQRQQQILLWRGLEFIDATRAAKEIGMSFVRE